MIYCYGITHVNPAQGFSLSWAMFTYGDTGNLVLQVLYHPSPFALSSARVRNDKTQSQESALTWGVSDESSITSKVLQLLSTGL